MTGNQLERRYAILENFLADKRDNYNIWLSGSFIDIRNKKTLEGIYTDSLQTAKRWLTKDIKSNNRKDIKSCSE